MRALILAAGIGTRLHPITEATPKCLVLIEGRPLLYYWLELLLTSSISKVLVNTHHLSHLIRKFVHESPWRDRVVVTYEECLLGTAGTLYRNRNFFDGKAAMLIHGDNLSLFSVPAFVQAYESRPAGVEITMMTFTTSTPQSAGIVELDDRGIVQSFHEKTLNPPSNLANGAVYIVSPSVLAFLESLGKDVIDFSTEVLPHYVGKINTFHNDVYHRDIGTRESLKIARREYQSVLARRGKCAT